MTSSVTNFFLDTEFTNLPWDGNSELLWIALVDETGTREFSAVNADCTLDACSPFVQQYVVPQLPSVPLRLTRVALARAVLDFTSDAANPQFWVWQPSLTDVAFLSGQVHASELHARYADWDYQLTCALLDEVPRTWPAQCGDVHALADASRVERPVNTRPHDPLADAHWTREVWLRATERMRLM